MDSGSGRTCQTPIPGDKGLGTDDPQLRSFVDSLKDNWKYLQIRGLCFMYKTILKAKR